MEEELQQLREQVMQLKADNERLCREREASRAGSSAAAPAPPAPVSTAPGADVSATVTERLVVVPRDRRCPIFNGKTGVSVNDWAEEVQACIRARRLTAADQALFMFDHLEGEAREEIKYRTRAEQADPDQIIAILKDLYGCTRSYIALQQAFFARTQQEGETLQEFSLALMALMERVKQQAPDGLLNSTVLLRDHFVEHVLDGALRRELKQLVRRQPQATLIEVRAEALRWEREGFLGGARERSHSLPAMYGLQYGVQSSPCPPSAIPQNSDLCELKELLKRQQEQLNQLTQTVASLHTTSLPPRHNHAGPLICRRCHQPGHFARECHGRQAPPQARASSAFGRTTHETRQAPSASQSEN